MERPSWIAVGVLVVVAWWLGHGSGVSQQATGTAQAHGIVQGGYATIGPGGAAISVAALPDQLAHVF